MIRVKNADVMHRAVFERWRSVMHASPDVIEIDNLQAQRVVRRVRQLP